jgi:hypothetical protein
MNTGTHYQKFLGNIGVTNINQPSVRISFDPRNNKRACVKLTFNLNDGSLKSDFFVIKSTQTKKVRLMLLGMIKNGFALKQALTAKEFHYIKESRHITGSQGKRRRDKQKNRRISSGSNSSQDGFIWW